MGGAGPRLSFVVTGDPATGDDPPMHTQSGERRFERFASHIIEIDIDSVRRRQIQLFEYRTGFVIEGLVKSTFLPQKLDLFRRTGGSDDTTSAQVRQWARHVAHGSGGARNKNDVAGLDLHQTQSGPGGHPRHAQRAKVNRERLDLAADRVQLFRRSHEEFPPAKVGSDGIARLEFPGANSSWLRRKS